MKDKQNDELIKEYFAHGGTITTIKARPEKRKFIVGKSKKNIDYGAYDYSDSDYPPSMVF